MKPLAFKGSTPPMVLYWVVPWRTPPMPRLTVLVMYKGKRNFVTYHHAWHDGTKWQFHDCTKLRSEKYIQCWANIQNGNVVED